MWRSHRMQKPTGPRGLRRPQARATRRRHPRSRSTSPRWRDRCMVRCRRPIAKRGRRPRPSRIAARHTRTPERLMSLRPELAYAWISIHASVAVTSAAVGMIAGARSAHADSAAALFDRANRLLEDGKVAEACEAFEAANRAEP